MWSLKGRAGAKGRIPGPGSPGRGGGGHWSLQFRPSLSFALSPDTPRGKESCFEVKLLKHCTTSESRPVCADATARRTGNTKQRPGTLASQPAARVHRESSEPGLLLEPEPDPEASLRAPRPRAEQQGAEA